MGSFILENEVTIDGSIKILRRFSQDLKLEENDFILTHGDQLTVNRVIGSQFQLQNEENNVNKLKNYLPIPGGFHLRWKFLKTIINHWWGDQHLPGSIAHARIFLERIKRVDKKATHFSHAHDLVEDLLAALLVSWNWKINGKDEFNIEQLEIKVEELLNSIILESKGGNCEFEATLILALLVYFDGHFSTKLGDGEGIIRNEKLILLHLLGTKDSKNYKATIARDLISCLYTLPPYYGYLSMHNRCVNLKGKEGYSKSVDHFVEHLVLLLKKSHTGGLSDASLETLSLSLDLFMEMKNTITDQIGGKQYKKHEKKANEKDILELAKQIYDNSNNNSNRTPKNWKNITEEGWKNREWLVKFIERLKNEEDSDEINEEEDSDNEDNENEDKQVKDKQVGDKQGEEEIDFDEIEDSFLWDDE